MFTGLIEAVCRVKSVNRKGASMELTVDLGKSAGQVKIGDSVAINGACLTVTRVNGQLANFDVSGETLAKSTLGELVGGSEVNVELAMKAGERFGGHFVQGHIDGIGAIRAIEKQGEFANVKFAAPAELLGQMIVKGSVAVDGISLTVAEMDAEGFSAAVIPKTLEATMLGKVKAGDKVNIETDIVVKTIKKQMENIVGTNQGLTVEKLKELGF